jgi:hypothetical protein
VPDSSWVIESTYTSYIQLYSTEGIIFAKNLINLMPQIVMFQRIQISLLYFNHHGDTIDTNNVKEVTPCTIRINQS